MVTRIVYFLIIAIGSGVAHCLRMLPVKGVPLLLLSTVLMGWSFVCFCLCCFLIGQQAETAAYGGAHRWADSDCLQVICLCLSVCLCFSLYIYFFIVSVELHLTELKGLLLPSRCGDSLGLCDGPLLPNTGVLKVFKMLQVCFYRG